MAKKKTTNWLLIFVLVLAFVSAIVGLSIFAFRNQLDTESQSENDTSSLGKIIENVKEATTPSSPMPTLSPIPTSKTLSNEYHIFQTFNNCGPAALSMALSYYDINVSQAELGRQLRPYQVAGGDNDDKSVTLAEVAAKGEEYGFTAYRRPNGTPELLEQFIANDMPVIVRTWLKVDDDIGHYRIVKGYNQNTKQFLQDDSLQGKDLWYSHEEFNAIWQKFNYEYVVLVPDEKVVVAQRILGEDLDEETAWQKAAQHAQSELKTNPNDIDAAFNLSVALYNSGDYESSVQEFEKVESRLPARTLWYQIEPILAYMQLKNYDRVLQITEKILNNQNRAFSELYILRGDIFKARGDSAAAKAEYEKAVRYNTELDEAKEKLNSV